MEIIRQANSTYTKMKFEIRKFDSGGIQKTEGGKSFKTEAKFRALIQTLARIYFGCLFEWIPKSKLIRRDMYTWKTYKKNEIAFGRFRQRSDWFGDLGVSLRKHSTTF